MNPQPLRVVKVGGSLLRHQPDAPAKETVAALQAWLAQQTPAVHVLVAGGGEFADLIRRADAAHNLGEEAAHWLCVDALSVTAQLLGAVLSLPVVTRLAELPEEIPSSCVFDPAPFFHDVEFRLFAASLPHTWAVTSDSIAARIAEYLMARELVLLKTCLPGVAPTGYVDDYFPAAAANLPAIRCVDLRSPSFAECPWVRGCMSQQPNIIVVGASARAAAFSALRAGMRPYAIDQFADCDLVDVCPAVKIKRYPEDFEQALKEAPQAPWIYTGGLENHPDLIDRMAAIRPLYGNGGEVLRKIRDPKLLADCLIRADVNFAVPEIRDSISPRDANKQWLRKPRRSSGGLGIRRARLNEEQESGANHYFQEQVPGDACSAVFLADSSGFRQLGFTEQQSGVADLPDQPFLYAGSAVGNLRRTVDWEYCEWLEDLGSLLAREFGLRGLFNLDLIGDYWLLEVNPRYSASVEVLEHSRGENFLAMHVAAFDPSFPVEKWCWISKSPSHVAKQVVYATGDCLVTPELQRLRQAWNVERLLPSLADIPRPGDRILRGQPVTTVIAEGWSNDEVQRLLHERVTAVRLTLMPEEERNLTQRHEGTEENVV